MTNPLDERALEDVELARYLATRVCDRAAGRLDDECTHSPPRDTYFIGCLRPVPAPVPGATPQRLPLEVLQKIAPSAFGLDAKLLAGADRLELISTLSWGCYHRIRPTRLQQIEHQGAPQPAVNGPGAATTGAPSGAAGRGRRATQRGDTGGVFPRFRKLTCTATGNIVLNRHSESWTIDCADFQRAIAAEIARAHVEIGQVSDRMKWSGTEERGLPPAALADDNAYDRFWAGLAEMPAPAWAWAVSTSTRPGDTEAEVVVQLEITNRSAIGSDDWRFDGFLFDPVIDLHLVAGAFAPFDLELIPRGFRYDRSMWGRGFNCGVVRERTEVGQDVLRTTNVPWFEQPRFVTSTTPPAAFEPLAADPIRTLAPISAAMHAYVAEWDRMEERYRAEMPEWDAMYAAEFLADRQKFTEELARFDRGLDLVRSDPDVALAFTLTNQAFSGNPLKPSWRLFQIVFLVTQIPGVAALKTLDATDLDDRRHVDIVYFPTGGGKTEAYLAIIVFHLFLDRLRGKSAGVSVWTRFPLRLLTLQQTQRAADVVGAAELIRRRHNDPRLSDPGVDGFSIGYLAGQEATPNELVSPLPGAAPDPNWSIATDPQARQRWKKVFRCPSCRTQSVIVDFDPQSVRVIHRCTEPTCAFPQGELPVHVVDNDLFRYLPSVVVGTIDKLASLGNQRKMALILGRVTGRCRIHGYCCQVCCQKNCRDVSLISLGVPRGISGPTLFVQDELHLLKEGLGTFDAHYETFVQELLRTFGQAAPLKIIASSATIEAFERQAAHLYGRPARVFPGLGPRLRESFYAVTREYPQRLYVGILPHNKTLHNAMLELLESYQREVWALRQLAVGEPSPFGGPRQPGTPEWHQLIDSYRTSLAYFSANRELSSLRTDLDSHSSPLLERDGVESFRIEELSGSTATDTVTRTLDRLEQGDLPNRPAPNLILATSMISHGVDIERLNAMFFFGMPRQNAEYIQASSRVGRTHCGIVFACMKPARERDQSHFAYFGKYHEFLGRLVEPVAINRWSKFSLQRTLPGLFMAVLLQDWANRGTQTNPGLFTRIEFVRRQISQGTLRVDDFIEILERAYLVKDRTDQRSADIRVEIGRRVGQFRDQIVSSGATAQWVSDALVPSPLRSLREVDEQVAIELDGNGSAWGSLVPNWGD
jgi:hypothetical protein